MTDLVTIAIHTGLKDWVCLLENSLKSFLVCNTYPNVELLLIESGQNKDVREWLESLDFNNFKNFDGTQTTIKPNPGVVITKKLLFPSFKDPQSGVFSLSSSPYIQSLELAFNLAQGKYFTYMAEDHQFVIVGNVISDYITMLEDLGAMKTMIPFLSPHKYKIGKKNNTHNGPHYITNSSGKKIAYYKIDETKWEQYMFCRKDLYDVLGPVKDWDVSHGVNMNYTKIAIENDIKRVYSGITPCMWFHDGHRKGYVRKIKMGTAKDPNFILFKMHLQEDILGAGKVKDGIYADHQPVTTEDFTLYNPFPKDS